MWQFKSIWALSEIVRKIREVSKLPAQTLAGMNSPWEARAPGLHPVLYSLSLCLEQQFKGNMLVALAMSWISLWSLI